MDIERIQTNADDAARMEFLDRAAIAFMQGYGTKQDVL